MRDRLLHLTARFFNDNRGITKHILRYPIPPAADAPAPGPAPAGWA